MPNKRAVADEFQGLFRHGFAAERPKPRSGPSGHYNGIVHCFPQAFNAFKRGKLVSLELPINKSKIYASRNKKKEKARPALEMPCFIQKPVDFKKSYSARGCLSVFFIYADSR